MGILLESGLYEGERPGLLSGSAAHEMRMRAEPKIDYEAAMQPLPSWIQLGSNLPLALPAVRGGLAAGQFVKQGSKEIIAGAEDVVSLARKLPRRIKTDIWNIAKAALTGRQLDKVEKKIANKEYPFDLGAGEDDDEFLGPRVFGRDDEDIDISEDEEEVDRQLIEEGEDPDSTINRTLERIELRNKESDKILEELGKESKAKSNVVSLDQVRGEKEIERQRAEDSDLQGELWATTGLMRHALDSGEELNQTDQSFINYILFNQMSPDSDLDLRAWSKEDIEERLESSWYSTVDRMFDELNDEDMDLLKNDMEVIIDHVSTKLKENPDVDYGGEVVAFPIDAGDSEPSDEVVFGESKVLTFPDHPDLPTKVIELPTFHVSIIRLPDDTYKAKGMDVRSREIKDLPKEIADLFIGKFNSDDIKKVTKLLEDFFGWED